MKQPIIRVENLKKAFDEKVVLEGINLEIYPGELFGLIGSSGSGKTTLLRILIGFFEPDGGDVLFRKEEGAKEQDFISVLENPNLIKRSFGFVSQVPSFYGKLSVYENLDYFGSLYCLAKAARLHNIKTLLKLVELENSKNCLAENLSGGMQRRLDIACSLIHDPDVLILDEPTSDLDPLLSKHIWKLIQSINRRGTTIIVASHHFLDVEAACSRVAIISGGRLEAIGAMKELARLLPGGIEIHIESYPGNYWKMMKHISDPLISKKEDRGSFLAVETSSPEKVLPRLFQVIAGMDESLIDLRIIRKRLGDVFSNVAKGERK